MEQIAYSKKEQGFTVVELLVALPIVVAVAFFLAYLVGYQYKMYNTQSAELAINADARRALDEIDGYVRQANRVASDYSSYATGPQTLVLQLPAVDGSGQAITGVYDNLAVYLSDTTLVSQLFAGAGSSRQASTKNLASNVDTANFSFTYDNASYALVTQVQTNLSLLQNYGGQTRAISVSSKATLRNY